MIFEGPMIIGAVIAMTLFHPGRVFDDLWVPAGKGVTNAVGDDTSTMKLTSPEEWSTGTGYDSGYQRV